MTPRQPWTAARQRAVVNTLLLFATLLASTIYMSELGGAGSIWTVVTWALAGLFILANLHMSMFGSLFMIPIALVALSTVLNLEHLPPAGIRSAVATIVGFLLFALPRVRLDRGFMVRLVSLYVIVVAGLSVWLLATNAERLMGGNYNYNVNPNAAAQQFFVGGTLAMFVLSTRLKWVAVILFALLLVTTQARTGNVAFLLVVLGYVLTSNRRRLPGLGTVLRGVVALIAFLAFLGLLVWLFRPEDFEALSRRFADLRNPGSFTRSRLLLWSRAIDLSLRSPSAFLFGYGPAQISLLIGRGAHSSYINAAASFGILFLASSLMVITAWMVDHARNGRISIIAIAVPILLYGLTDTFVFSGVSFLWLLLAFVGIWLEARPVGEETVARPFRDPTLPINSPWHAAHP